MTDINSLNGASVRDTRGHTGRSISVTDSSVNIAWMKKGIISEEKTLDRTAVSGDLQILTLKEGWRPLVSAVGKSPDVSPSACNRLVEDLNSIMEAAKKKTQKEPKEPKEPKAPRAVPKAFGKKKHSPYKDLIHHGPAAGGDSTREVSQRKKWDCVKTAPYKQKCYRLKKDKNSKRLRRDKSKKPKPITIKKSYKLGKYNPGYKPWRAKQGW